jgi:carboxyl-terminal processing protease
MNSRFKLVVVTSSTVLVVLLLLGAVLGRSASPEDAYRHLAVYTEVLSRIKSEYVEEPDIKNVTLGAVNGMLEAIDPFASYLNADQYKQYLKNQDSKKAGVGLILSKKFGYVGVVDVIPNTAASKAGLTTGDLIESIGGIATRDMPLAYAEMLLVGDSGTSVEVSVLRIRKPDPQKISLIRGAVKYPAVSTKLLPDDIGLVQVGSLETGKLDEVTAAVRGLEKQGAKKLILDLRNCAVGKTDDGAKLANLFIDKGLLTYVVGQKVAREDSNADAAKAAFKEPLVVMTNRGTAGAAEIASAALLDDKRAELVGERTYGDASQRKAITMEDGAAVILSVAKYYSPTGKSIQDVGVTPGVAVNDAEVAPEPDEENPTPEAQPDKEKKGDDAILKKAIEVITKGKAMAGLKPALDDPLGLNTQPNTPLHIPEKQPQ